MPVFGQTEFNWMSEGGGVREDYAVGSSRVSAPVNIRGATAKKRLQAAVDFIGYNVVKTASLGGATVRYISRALPLPYPVPLKTEANPTKSPYLWCSALTAGRWDGVFRYNTQTEANDAEQYSWCAIFTPRLYEIKEDGFVVAQIRSDGGPTSPLYYAGPPASSLPDEGDSLRRGYPSTRYISREISEAGKLVGIQGAMLRYGPTEGNRPTFPQTYAFNEVTGRVVYTWWLVPLEAVPLSAIEKNLGTLNPYQFDAFAPRVMRFDSWNMDIQPGPLGDLLANVQYVFSLKQGYSRTQNKALGHNSVFRAVPVTAPASPTVLDYVPTFAPDGTTPAPYYDSTVGFESLFRPDQP